MGRTLIGLILVLALFASLAILGWHFAKDRIRPKQEYRLSADRIIVPTPPEWVPDQFVGEVLQNSELTRTGYLLDNTLPKKLAEAFAAYPWVERVDHVVLRYPSGADVQLSYRVPVALVDIPQRGMSPVDRNGVLLPPEYLSDTFSDRWSKHLVIQGVQSIPLGSAGTPWGDPMVHAAAQLAAALTDVAEPLKLTQIIPKTETVPVGTRIVCQLRTAGGTEIHWGTVVSDDLKIEAQKKKLWDLHDQFHSLDNIPAAFRPVDLSRE